jgi:dihydroorotate dehydrogenase (NAD+) catalytic subunit
MSDILSVKIGSLKLKNPVMVASGTFGYGEEFDEKVFPISKLGAVVTKGISLLPRKGNPMPRVVEAASGMLNAIGLANVGVEEFVAKKLPFLVKTGATVIANIFGSTVDEYTKVAEALEPERGVAAVEVNISCPNVKAGGVLFGTDPKLASEVVAAVRKKFKRTMIVKLSPQVSSIKKIAAAVVDAGADSISLINTIPAMAIDAETMKPVLANVTGGLSGPAIKPVALKLVYECAAAVKVPIIGMGGIMNATDAVEFILAGATAVQIGTANFVRPNTALEVIDGIGEYCKRKGVTSVGKLVRALKV